MSYTTERAPSAQSEEVTLNQTVGELQNIQSAYRLNGKNYIKWSQLVRIFLKGKGKLSHLLGTGPKKGDPRFDAWDEEDSTVMSWLWNSMLPEISDTFMFLPTSKEIWEAAQQTYSKVRDAARVFEIKSKISDTKQGDRSVTEYANLLKNLWQEMDHYRCIEMKCSDDATVLKNFIEKDRTYDFLAGLNIEFDQVRIQILGKEELPSLNETISIINAEESRRGVMLYAQPVEESAMLGKIIDKNPKEDMSHADVNSSGGEENGFNKEDIGRLRSLIDSLEKSKADVTFVEEESYFSSHYLQGNTSSMEDKDLFLREPSMLVKTSPVQTKSTPEVELISRGDSEAEPIESFPNLSEEPSRPINPTFTMPLKVYSRRIKPVINPVQVQETESSLGNEHSTSGGVTALIVYVDDIIVTGNDSDEKEALRKYLAKEFEIKDLGKLKYFLGIEVARSKEGIFVSQQKYVLDLLEETVYQILQYLKGSPGRGILFRKGTNMELEAYTDADYAGSLTDRRSTSGYCTFLGRNLVTWRSKKQPVVAKSSSEAEFRSMAQGICELLWLKIILNDLKIKLETPMKLYCDNKSVINIAHNPV
ncbi:hypothetical protein RJ640_026031 [Escallonia rubra]|uniref:Reverse transcriptase Ty1/copia-type domain-containing protein n=1 Tax=Escallonia rubra TaxID=112253 RepID=A0AA88UEJ0_9ASTE|nr:hypothetical protein RJ640_026031 [Escallonia rubra]